MRWSRLQLRMQKWIQSYATHDCISCAEVISRRQQRFARIAHARVMAEVFCELDTRRPRTPVTIGFAFEEAMGKNADVVDVLSYHDYRATREGIRSNIVAALVFAAKVKKPVINTEIGCTGRANPCDVVIEEYANAHLGFYIWELMITAH